MPDSLQRFQLDSLASRARVDAPGYEYFAASRLTITAITRIMFLTPGLD